MIYLTDRQLDVLLYVRDGRTIPDIMRRMNGKSPESVRRVLKELADLGLIRNVKNDAGHTKVGGRELTELGKETLKDHGHDFNRPADLAVSRAR